MAQQLEAYAFNVMGYAVAIPDSIGNNIIKLTARNPTTVKFDTALEQVEKRSIIELTPQEKDFNSDDESTEQFLLVGLTYPKLGDEYLKKHPALNKQASVGTTLLEGALVEEKGDDIGSVPAIVVTPLKKLEGSMTKLYALANPQDGLYTPYGIKQEACFYLPMFRDNSTALQARKSNWNKNLRLRGEGSATPKSVPKKLIDDTKLRFDSRQTLASQLLVVVSAALTDEGGGWGPRAIQTLSQTFTKEHESQNESTIIKSLVNLDVREWDDEMSIKFIDELARLHYRDKVKSLDLKPQEITLLKNTLLSSEISVDEANVISFAHLGISALRRATRTGQPPADILRQSIEIWQEQREWIQPSPAISAEDDSPLARLVLALENTLQEIVVAADTETRALLTEVGDVRPKTLEEVIGRYAEDLTRDGFKQTVTELYWLIKMETIHSEERVVNAIRQLLNIIGPVLPKLRDIAGDSNANDDHGAASDEENVFSDDAMDLT